MPGTEPKPEVIDHKACHTCGALYDQMEGAGEKMKHVLGLCRGS